MYLFIFKILEVSVILGISKGMCPYVVYKDVMVEWEWGSMQCPQSMIYVPLAFYHKVLVSFENLFTSDPICKTLNCTCHFSFLALSSLMQFKALKYNHQLYFPILRSSLGSVSECFQGYHSSGVATVPEVNWLSCQNVPKGGAIRIYANWHKYQ